MHHSVRSSCAEPDVLYPGSDLVPDPQDVYDTAIAWALHRADYEDLTADELVTLTAEVGRNLAPTLLIDLWFEDALTADAASYIVPYVWSLAEFPEYYVERDDWLGLFDLAGYTVNERPAARPTQPIRVWRGCPGSHASRMAWTADPQVATWFANRWQWGTGHAVPVWTAVAQPEQLLAAILDGRDESEYVINPEGLCIEEWGSDRTQVTL